MLRRFKFDDGKLIESTGDDCPVFVYANPDENERKYIIDTLHIDEHNLNSALDPDEIGRVEFEPDQVAIIFKRPRNYSSTDNFLFKVWTYGLFLFPNRLVVVQAEDSPLFDGRHFVRMHTPRDAVLRLIYRTSYHFVDHMKGINMIANDLEQKISVSMENRYLLNMFTLEKSLVYYLNAINANDVVIEKLKLNALKIGFDADNLEFLDDLIIENKQCYRQAEILSNIFSSLMDARASIVSNNLNVLMKTLNLITIGIMVPTLVVSIFSMNVWMPFSMDNPGGFFLILVLAALSVTGMILWWRRKRW